MKQYSSNTRNGGEGLRDRLGTKAVAAVAAISLVASMCPGTVALAYANDQLAAGSAEVSAQALSVQIDDDAPYNAPVVTADTHVLKSGAYRVTSSVNVEPDGSGNAVQVEKGASVLIYIDEGVTLTAKGKDAVGNGVGHAAILLGEGAALTVMCEGTLEAIGGKAGAGTRGGNAEGSVTWH